MSVHILNLLVISLLLLVVTLGSGWITRLPLSYAIIYLGAGLILSPHGIGLLQVRPDAEFLERLTEFVVLVSLFSCGLKMNRPLRLRAWGATIRLIGLLMPLSILALAALGHWALGLGWGESVLLGAILSPTDPVLASEVQLNDLDDRNGLRFGLTSEGGLNDALAFPFIYFGLHGLEDEHWQNWLKQWVAVDLVWAIAAGLVMGILVPKLIAWIDAQVQRYRPVDSLMEDFLALSIILATYSLTELINGYGFLAVFVAGVVTQRSYKSREKHVSQLEFMEKIEKLLEVGTVLLLGSLLRLEPMLQFAVPTLLVAGSLIFIIRPLGTWLSTIGSNYHPIRRWLFGWFGIRGVGSIYYLSYALGEGLEGTTGELIAWITYTTIVISVIIHGISSTPLMRWYESRLQKYQKRLEEGSG